ncbi:MAG: tetratricopeptide repeat protein [Desulfobacterales bacterium]|nr:tetratricopeptide repeat protein [Desulfobacterales bacterium]
MKKILFFFIIILLTHQPSQSGTAPDNAIAYKNSGIAHLKSKQYDLAIEDFEKAAALMPILKGLFHHWGVACYFKSDYEGAIEKFSQEITLFSPEASTYFHRALCEEELKQYAKSYDDISRALELNPAYYMALCLKGDLLANTGKIERAASAYKAAIKTAPDKSYAWEQLALLKIPLDSIHISHNSIPKEERPADEAPQPLENTNTHQPGEDNEIPNYTLQAGAYRVKYLAQKLRENLNTKGCDARILTLTLPENGIWYLVRIGDYPGYSHARKAEQSLRERLDIQTIIRKVGKF